MRPTTLAIPLLILTACGDKDDDSGATDTGEESGPEPTWENVRDDVLVPSCGFSSCHAPPGSAQFGVDADSLADDYVEVPAFQDESYFLVDPGNPDDSYLLMKLEGAAGISNDAMPPPDGGMDAARVQLVRDWIAGLE
jgi:hypothetical protein